MYRGPHVSDSDPCTDEEPGLTDIISSAQVRSWGDSSENLSADLGSLLCGLLPSGSVTFPRCCVALGKSCDLSGHQAAFL